VDPDPAASADVGLLSPVWAGTRAEELTSDAAVVRAMLRASAALLTALSSTGLAPASVGASAPLVESLEVDARDLALAAVPGGNPVIPLVPLVRATVPADVAEWVHFGATSQDILDTALMLVATDVVASLDEDLVKVANALAGLARSARDVPMAGRTLGQQALPTTLGMRAAGWLAGVHDALRAVRGCSVLPVSLGGPVGTAAAYGERAVAVCDGYASALGRPGATVAPWHTRRTPVLSLSYALATCGAALGRIAEDVIVMAQTEVGEAREGTGGPSSSMPHKANPTRCVLVAAAARQVPALASVIGASAVSSQDRPAGAWHAEWQPLRELLRLAGGAAARTADLVPGAAFDHGAMTRNLGLLLGALDRDEAWLAEQVAPCGAWVDRVLARHAELLG
jgi:3-carboxy-cis,cis-muconate cycloisomerase